MGKTVQTLTGTLNAEFIDNCAEMVSCCLLQWGGVPSRKVLEVRLSMEGMLLKWMDRDGNGRPVQAEVTRSFRSITVLVSMGGAPHNPLLEEGDNMEWTSQLFRRMGKAPAYSYRRGKNQLRFRIEKEKNPMKLLFISFGLALLIGGMGNLLLSDTIRATVSDSFFQPICNTFLRMLAAIAGPVSFIAVIRGVCQVYQSAQLGHLVKQFLVRVIGMSLAVTAVSVLVEWVIKLNGAKGFALGATGLSETFRLLLDFIPGDVLSPFLSNDTPKIIVLALVLGGALLKLGEQMSDADDLIEKLERILDVVVGWISELAPIFAFFILVKMMWDGDVQILYYGWVPMLCVVAVCGVTAVGKIGFLSGNKRIAPGVLAKKLWKPFKRAFLSGCSSEYYQDNLTCFATKLGVSPAISEVLFPLGLVVYMPTTAVSTALVTLYLAEQCGVVITGTRVMIVILLSVGLSITALPVPGSALVNYAVIFSYLAIPENGLAAVLVIDAVLGFFSEAMNLSLLQVEMIYMADRLKGLDEEILRQ